MPVNSNSQSQGAQAQLKVQFRIWHLAKAKEQPRFKENSTWQILKFEVTNTRGLAWTRFSRSLGKTYF
jgi:hypothetical protein